MAKKLSSEEVNRRLFNHHGDIVKIDHSTFKGMGKKALFIDVEYGEWWAFPVNVLNGTRHPERSRRSKWLPLSEIERKIRHIHGEQVKIISSTFRGIHKTATFVDIDFGKFKNRPVHVFEGQGHPARIEDRKKKTCLKNLGVEYSMQSKNTQKKRKKTWMKKYGVDNPMKCEEIKSKIDRDSISKKAHETMKRENSYGKSRLEDEFYEVLCELFNTDDIIRQKIVKRWPIDFYIKSIDLYIQFDGVYWHGLDRPIKRVNECFTNRDKNIRKTFIKDQKQNLWFKENGLQLIRITDKQFVKWKKSNNYSYGNNHKTNS